MQALILATDEAGKLHPLTERAPAPLLPVLNRPVMAYALELLMRSGLRDIGIAVYKKAGAIEAHFGAGSRSGVQLTYLLQREALGSAGSIRWAASGLKQTFVVLPGDAMLDVDICAALEFHQSRGAKATAIVHEPLPGRPVQRLTVAPDGRVTALPAGEAGPLGPPGARTFAATGAYIFEPQIFDCIPPRQVFDCYSDLLPELLGLEALQAYVADGYWNPIDNIPAYHRAQLDALAGAAGAVSGTAGGEGRPVRYVPLQDRELAPGVIVGRHVSVHPTAHLAGPVYIGNGSQIERDVELGPGVVIGPNSVVDEGATVRNSSILEGTYVGRLVNVDSRVVRGGLVIDAASGDRLRVVDPFLLGEISPRLIGGLLSRAADIVGALVLLLLSLPALALITLALLLTSLFTGNPGRVFELRPRVRWRGPDQDRTAGEDEAPERETYGVVYFRTRAKNGRLPLGSFLERTQLDRLPALLTVLTGDLRLVGVKPLEPAEASRLVEEWQRLAYEATAGFTGLWYVQAEGADLDEVVATDAYYTATRSLGEDLRLLFGTPLAWLGRRVPPRNSASQPARRRSGARARLSDLAEAANPVSAKRVGD